MKLNKTIVLMILIIVTVSAVGYYYLRPKGINIIRLATTTSVDNTGLLNYLKTYFENENPDINLTWVAVGTGQAIDIGTRGDADVVLCHYRPLEDQFIKDGYGINGVTIAYNDFIIVGPSNDTANVSSANNVVEAFRLIANSGSLGNATFVSRGDGSGTNLKELDIWKAAGLNASNQAWYKETGQGMSQTLTIADNLGAYTLTDRSTYISLTGKLKLKVIYENDPSLLNFYRVIIVNPAKYPNLHSAEAEKFVMFLVSNEGQTLIGNYTKKGQKLFNPAFGKLTQLGVNDTYEDEQVIYWQGKLKT